MTFVAYHNRSRPTGEILTRVLQGGGGVNIPTPFTQEDSTLIRWGSRANKHLDDVWGTVINTANAIELCSHKFKSLEVMEQAGVNVPAFAVDPLELREICGYPLLGRKYRHARGTDIKLCLQNKDFRNRCDYYIAYIPTKREYRVHVVGDEVIRIQGKFLDIPSEAKSWIRNYTSGYRFRSPRLRLRPDRLEMSVKAVKSLGLHFGAVDLIIGDDDLCYVLEVNTAPSCSPLTLTAYAVALQNLTGIEQIDLEHLNLLDPSLEEMDTEDEEGED